MAATRRAIIAGAGIGGLSAALCFRKAGWDVEVLEQAPEIGEAGAGIQISPNGMKVLRALGVAEKLEAGGFRPQAIEMRTGRGGRRIFSIPLAEVAEQRWGAPYLHIHRADLLAVLSGALLQTAPGAIHTGARITGYRQEAARISALLESGQEVSGDVLIGADGLRSVVRSQMMGPDNPRFTGNIAWRSTVPVNRLGDDVPPPAACIWTGHGRHAVTYLLRGGTLANFVGIVRHDGWQKESWTEEGRAEDVRADFAGWHPVIRALIDNADTHFRWALFDRSPLARWSDGRAVLLGDACHPMLPTMAQGAVMAIEDAWVLARFVGEAEDIPAALEAYYAARIGRTSRVQRVSCNNARIFHLPMGGLPVWLAASIAPGMLHARQDWLYGASVV